MMSLANFLFAPCSDFLSTSNLGHTCAEFLRNGPVFFPPLPPVEGPPLFPSSYLFGFVEGVALNAFSLWNPRTSNRHYSKTRHSFQSWQASLTSTSGQNGAPSSVPLINCLPGAHRRGSRPRKGLSTEKRLVLFPRAEHDHPPFVSHPLPPSPFPLWEALSEQRKK